VTDLQGLESMHKHECWATRLVADPNLRAAAIEIIGDEPPDGYPDGFDWEDSIQAVIEQTVKPVIAAAFTPGDT
jgi:hypothetical protein